jgi:hypothetical protein
VSIKKECTSCSPDEVAPEPKAWTRIELSRVRMPTHPVPHGVVIKVPRHLIDVRPEEFVWQNQLFKVWILHYDSLFVMIYIRHVMQHIVEQWTKKLVNRFWSKSIGQEFVHVMVHTFGGEHVVIHRGQ